MRGVQKEHGDTIFKATYSGVPVYEFLCRGVPVMRRKADNWLNATQILKVANFDKPQRTRILEREVQKGHHEKIQGGYGKYQGTWVPFARGVELASQYKVEDLLKPMIDFMPSSESPPPAPKHITAASNKPKLPPAIPRVIHQELVTAPSVQFAPRRTAIVPTPGFPSSGVDEGPPPDPTSSEDEDGGSGYDTQSVVSSLDNGNEMENVTENEESSEEDSRHKRKRSHDQMLGEEQYNRGEVAQNILGVFVKGLEDHALERILEESAQFDINSAIDQEGHTALHWAAAMGRVDMISLLLQRNADPTRSNFKGETALVRATHFNNNYELRRFEDLVDLLARSVLVKDHANRSVFHHIANLTSDATKRGRSAKYYMYALLDRYPQLLDQALFLQVLNWQDEDGDTALTIAAKNRARKIIKRLIDAGADLHIMNRLNRTPQEYIDTARADRLQRRYHRQTSSSPMQVRQLNNFNQQNSAAAYASQHAYRHGPLKFGSHLSESARQAIQKTMPDMSDKVDALAIAFDKELEDKERNFLNAQDMIRNMDLEIEENKRSLDRFMGEIQQSLPSHMLDSVVGGTAGSSNGHVALKEEEPRYLSEKIIKHLEEDVRIGRQELRNAIERTQIVELAALMRDAEKEQHNKELQINGNGASFQLEAEAEERDRLEKELEALMRERGDTANQSVDEYENSGVGEKMGEYRRLIAQCIRHGGPVEIIDEMLQGLEEGLKDETEKMSRGAVEEMQGVESG